MGGKRGRLVSPDDRQLALSLIDEATENGARLIRACGALSISVSTYRRWRNGNVVDLRKGAEKNIPRKLTQEEEREILRICNSQKYKDYNPYEIHASLLDEGIYIASISSFYRVLRKADLMIPRREVRGSSRNNRPPEKKATGPNQVWTWDITWLKTNVRGLFYYAYVIIDIWDRSIVKWSIHDREDDALAHELFQRALRDNDAPDVFVHSDNGNPMKGATLLGFFNELGICNSYSRPRVSNDNPFIESWFKTLKYDVSYPGKFDTLKESREWFAAFVSAYNNTHAHSGMNFITPHQVRSGEYTRIARNRNSVLQDAFERNPHRWSGSVRQLPEDHVVYLNPTADTRIKLKDSVA